jgi:lipoprotein-releasing system permease protein
MGLTRLQTVKVFMLLGLFNGLKGVIGGVIAGVALALSLPELAQALESLMGHSMLDGDVYFISHLPSQLHWMDVALTAAVALMTAILATLYPAWQASRVQPARELGAQ